MEYADYNIFSQMRTIGIEKTHHEWDLDILKSHKAMNHKPITRRLKQLQPKIYS